MFEATLNKPATAGAPTRKVPLELRFERTLRSLQHRVYGYCRHFLGNEADAEDVTQEVFIRLWHHLEHLDDEGIPGWVLRVARNACIDLTRSRKSAHALFSTTSPDLPEAGDPDPGPDAVTESAEFQDLLQQALARMGEPQRSILILREIQDLKYEDIAETLELPLNTVKVYLHRARRALRVQLAEVTSHAHA